MAKSKTSKREFSVLSPEPVSPSSYQDEKRTAVSIPAQSFPQDAPDWAKYLNNSIHVKIDELEKTVNASINYAVEKSEEASSQATENTKKIEVLQTENENLKVTVKALSDKIMRIESYGRRENLLFHGLKEEKSENCMNLITQLLTTAKIPCDHITTRTLVRVHRNPPGPHVPGKNRPIIARFHHFDDRMAVWLNRNKLPDGVYITEDFPQEIQRRRRKLAPYLSLAKTLPSIKATRMVEDRLIIDGKVFTVDNLGSLPVEFTEKATATLTKDGVTAFFSAASPLSNHYPCNLEIDGQNYHSVEQFCAAKKAKHAMNQASLDKILKSKDAKTAYQEAKAIRMSPALLEAWRREHSRFMEQGMVAKFGQNDDLATHLKETKGNLLVEATMDPYWGAGKSIRDPSIFKRDAWKGKNHCGTLLMKVRTTLLS